MQLQNTITRYGAVAKTFHWLLAVLIIGLLAVGLYMEGLPNSPDKFQLYGLHKSIGVIVLFLVAARLAWRIRSLIPPLPEAIQSWQRAAANASHQLLYICMVLMPVSGWGMSSAAGYPVSVFGLFALPPLVEKNEMLGGIFRQTHQFVAYGLIALLIVHASAAFYHHFIQKDDVFRRMWPGAKV